MSTLEGKGFLAAIPVAGAAGTGAYFGLVKSSNSKETIKSKLELSLKGKARKILTSKTDVIWEKYKVLYEKSSQKISGVNKNELPNWCSTTLEKEYSDKESPLYDNASKWCVANTNTLKKELESKGIAFLSFEDGSDSKWQHAWTKYESEKASLTITDDSLKSLTSDANAGGPKLKEWCKVKLEKYMYEDLGEEKVEDKVSKYCVERKD
ncbi:hypothetical protein HF1_13950 [Mycoplasma haemofelis str. Langford 1]|uniref:Uncharacterized protein n=1 Tax=Mycoplasma haemofelis (strain Langford 1) TaxID=941640 RepID=E8ZJT2_MYCHL|nr:hypothetical protein [Mycoplasma haemofelis]CBY93403.1 hypothetical protein HF1_13950 [Mycoplasma haemofelis str. Langford 1]